MVVRLSLSKLHHNKTDRTPVCFVFYPLRDFRGSPVFPAVQKKRLDPQGNSRGREKYRENLAVTLQVSCKIRKDISITVQIVFANNVDVWR